MRRITVIPCYCVNPDCGWKGFTGDCDATEDGDLFCPKCEVYLVRIEYNEHEKSPTSNSSGSRT